MALALKGPMTMHLYQRILATPFQSIPLLTPEAIASSPLVLTDRLPDYPFTLILPDDGGASAVIWIGEVWPSGFVTSPVAVGVILEAARVGIRLTTDQTLQPVFRVPNSGTGGADAVIPMRKLLRFGDVFADADPDWHADGPSRQRFIQQADRLAQATLLGGMWPDPNVLGVADYTANLRALLQAHDHELTRLAQPVA